MVAAGYDGDATVGRVAAALDNVKGVLKVLHRGGGAILFDEPVRGDALRGEPAIHAVGLGHALAIALPAAEDGGTAGVSVQIFHRALHAVDERERRPVIQHGGAEDDDVFFLTGVPVRARAADDKSLDGAEIHEPHGRDDNGGFPQRVRRKAAERDERRCVGKSESDVPVAAHGTLEEQREDEEDDIGKQPVRHLFEKAHAFSSSQRSYSASSSSSSASFCCWMSISFW